MKRTAFKIPMQSEVWAYIKNKMGWPDKFCDHYSEKFWNHYQASGWKLSSGNAIKDWQACFNSQWKQLKFKEDIELLNSLTGKIGSVQVFTNGAKSPITDMDKADAFFQSYRAHPTQISFKEFGAWYPLLKNEGLLRRFTALEIEQIKEIYNCDNEKCRCAVVQLTFDEMAKTGLTFEKLKARL